MHPKKLAFLAVQLAFLTCVTPGNADLITNGGFESPPLTPVVGLPVFAVSDQTLSPNIITSWTTSSGDSTLVRPDITGALGIGAPEQGSQYVVLNGLSLSVANTLQVGAVGTLSQGIVPQAGHTYQVQYYVEGLGVSALNGTAALQVNVTNATAVTAPNGGLLNVTASLNTFTPETFNFTATANSSVISFGEPVGSLANASGVALDNITITEVPEPSTTMAYAVGFMCVLLLFRHLRERQDQPASEFTV